MFKFSHLLNIDPIVVTFPVSKDDKSKFCNDVQPWNIDSIVVTFSVLIPASLSSANFEHLLNKLYMFVTLDVSSPDKSNDTRFVMPPNRPCMSSSIFAPASNLRSVTEVKPWTKARLIPTGFPSICPGIVTFVSAPLYAVITAYSAPAVVSKLYSKPPATVRLPGSSNERVSTAAVLSAWLSLSPTGSVSTISPIISAWSASFSWANTIEGIPFTTLVVPIINAAPMASACLIFLSIFPSF